MPCLILCSKTRQKIFPGTDRRLMPRQFPQSENLHNYTSFPCVRHLFLNPNLVDSLFKNFFTQLRVCFKHICRDSVLPRILICFALTQDNTCSKKWEFNGKCRCLYIGRSDPERARKVIKSQSERARKKAQKCPDQEIAIGERNVIWRL